jgi:hypothetical protein
MILVGGRRTGRAQTRPEKVVSVSAMTAETNVGNPPHTTANASLPDKNTDSSDGHPDCTVCGDPAAGWCASRGAPVCDYHGRQTPMPDGGDA